MIKISNKEPIIIQIVADLQKQFSIDASKAKDIISQALDGYEITNIIMNCQKSDLPEKIMFFLDTRRLDGLSEKTLHTYKSELFQFCRCCSKPVAQITINDLRSYISEAQTKHKLKRTTINNKITTLRTFFQFLTAEEILIKDPSTKLKTLKVDVKNLRKELDEEELEILRNACKSAREKALVEFLVSTGCRVSETTHVKVSDIDWNDRSLTVLGKGNKSRKVFFSVKAKIHIKTYLSQRKGESDCLFISEHSPYQAINKDQVEKSVRTIAKRTNIKKPVTPHVLRHSFATMALARGMDITIIQQLLGHENLGTTQIYASTSEQMLKRAYEQYAA